MENVLDSVVEALQRNPNRRFVFAEMVSSLNCEVLRLISERILFGFGFCFSKQLVLNFQNQPMMRIMFIFMYFEFTARCSSFDFCD